MLDVAVHADRAAVDDAAHSGAGGGVDQLADGRRVDLVIDTLGQAGLAVQRGDVVDDLEVLAGQRRRQGLGAREIAGDDGNAVAFQVAGRRARGAGRRTHHGPHLVAAPLQRAREVAAGESRRPGDEDLHRSATTVTGEPNSRISPVRSMVPSTRRVHDTEFNRLWSAIGSTNWRCSPVT